MTRLEELLAIPDHLLTHDESRERELLAWQMWRKRLFERCQTPDVREFHERHGRKPGDPIRLLSFEDRYRSEQDQQNKVERQ